MRLVRTARTARFVAASSESVGRGGVGYTATVLAATASHPGTDFRPMWSVSGVHYGVCPTTTAVCKLGVFRRTASATRSRGHLTRLAYTSD